MTKERALEMIEDLKKFISNCDKSQELTPEQTFLSIIKDYVIKEDKDEFPNSVFYLNSNGKVLFELNKKTKILWCNLNLIWNVFYDKYDMDYNEFQSFIKDMVKKHFKMRDVTPQRLLFRGMDWWRNI